MTPEQKQWLSDHPEFKQWFPHSMVSIMGWTDVGYLTPWGEGVIGEIRCLPYMGGAFALGNTIYAPNAPVIKVGREYMIC